ncbi:DUF305 domain-containing protein [Oxalobacteraceae bacterium OTU3CINTB1]|nr:DUF305 domain-containing protein [Oxalobacteraceae bacterium OTU3CINTB1]
MAISLRAAVIAAIAAMMAATGTTASAQEHHHGGATPASAPPAFVASTAKPFAALMDDAMSVMDDGMKRAPMNGVPDHDFMTMMIPHHQGAVDMAKSVLLHTTDPEIRNLALGIIAEQQVEIDVMKAWLHNHPTKEIDK